MYKPDNSGTVMNNTTALFSQLVDLNRSSSDIQASALIASDGSVIVSVLGKDLDKSSVGMNSALMLSLGEHTVQEFMHGDLEEMLIKSNKGYFLLSAINKDTMLTVLTKASSNNQTFSSLKQTAAKITKLMRV
jgi:predicted regulator of Ras-like GTPase activity (Roadblock/LC7/MglB family)